MNQFDFYLSLTNDKIILRPMINEDYISFEKLTGDKSMWLWFTEDLSDKFVLSDWVSKAVRDRKDKIRLAFTIIDKITGAVIGSTSYGNISFHDTRIEIGWTWIAKDYQGKRINDQVKYLMMQYAFESLGFERVEFKTDVLNVYARKALIRIGATEEGVLRSHTLMTRGRRRDTIYYSVLKPEWGKISISRNK
jgi:RimJ/RimL family protein N-acetyltransferase